jgi:adenine-specific DNA-methyltransferase
MAEKLKMQTPNITEQNIEQIAKLFPNVITESRDEKGHTKKAIDFELLKQNLSDVLVDDENERYRLDWPGKKASLLKANTLITKTLRPCREESVNFDTTENLYIEGDNFEVLKILQESYLGKIKMIYIDPPYNTGNDFLYKDDFNISKNDYEDQIGVIDDEGERLFKNTDSNGRFHSDWLSMMYERLVLSRDLLKNDGVIFISIGEHEVHNLRKLCDEIFGEGNFIGEAGRITKKANNQGDFWAPNFDYILTYSRNKDYCNSFFGGINYKAYKETETEGDRKGEKYQLIRLYMTSLDPMRGCKNQRYFIKCPDGSFVIPPGDNFPSLIDDGSKIEPKSAQDKIWRWASSSYKEKRNQLIIKKVKSSNLVDQNGEPAKWNVFTKTFLNDVIEKSTASPNNFIENHLNQGSSHELKKLEILFDFAKPSSLIKFLAETCRVGSRDIVLDFFSGSSSAAQAVIQHNVESNSRCKFIMVQLPEKTDKKSDIFKAGFDRITEIGKERIRRAGKKIIEENKDKQGIENQDIGFRVYKTDSSNMKDVYYHPNALGQVDFDDLISNIKDDRTPDDLLTQVILDLGLELNLPIEEKKILENTVFIVQSNALVACFDDNINFSIVDKIAELSPFKVVFKDASFKDDKDRINVEERFKRLSPDTIISVI